MNKIERMLQELCPEGVEYKKLEDIGCLFSGLTGKSKEDFKDGNAKFVSYMNVYSNPALNLNIEDKVRISDEEEQNAIQYGDILFTGSSETPDECGMTSIVTQKIEEDIYLNSFCFGLRLNNIESFDVNFLKHLFRCDAIRKLLQKTANGVTRFNVSKKRLLKIEIPVPPLEVQTQIAYILDHFTELTASLQAELQTRQEQYKYYKDQLLKLNVAEYRTLGSLSKFRRGSFPQPYGNKDWYDGDGAMPFVQVADIADDKKLVANTKRKISSLAQPMSVFAPKGSIIISLQGSIGKIAITQYDAYIDRTLAIFQNITNDVLPKYFVYQLERIFEIKEKTARGSTIKTITKEEFTNFQIPIPSISEQKRIVSVLDKFETLVNDLSKGLPAEIAAVQEQYEYYRNKLLMFNRIKSN